MPTTPSVPLETQQDRAIYDYFISTEGRSNGASELGGGGRREGGGKQGRGAGGAESSAASAEVWVGDGGSRPETGRRPGSSRSARFVGGVDLN